MSLPSSPAAAPLRVAVTGSTGLLGREIVAQLASLDVPVVALRRREQASWRAQCTDVEAVIHLAAPTADLDVEAVDEALTSTRVLFDALPDRSVHVVFAGTMALYEPLGSKGALTEQSRMWQGVALAAQELYTQMKSAQEGLVRSLCTSRGWPLTIIRPTNVWSGDKWYQSCVGPKVGPLWLVVAPSRRLRLVHVENCARAFVAALRRPVVPPPLEINIDDDAGVSAWRYATKVVDRHAHRYLPLPLPGWLFDGATAVAKTLMQALVPRRRVPGLLLRDRRRARFGEFSVDTRAARRSIRWAPDLGTYGSDP